MPVETCQVEGKQGFRWGSSGTCYTHDGTAAGKAAAKQKAVKQAIAANNGTAPRDLEQAEPELVAEALRELADLETITIPGVEILEADVTIHGVGSPPEGDRWSSDDLRAMATAAQELEAAGEWRIPATVQGEPLGRTKLGHGKEQTLLSSSELPAAGWLTNQRVSDDGKKLIADVTDVPAKIAALLKAKAYRSRSSELGSVKSQKTGKQYPWVVTGLGWLGGKLPAVKTLDELPATWYEGDDSERLFVQVDEVEAPSVEELRDLVARLGSNFFESRRHSPRMPDKPKFTDEQRRKFSEALAEHEVEVKPEDVTDEMLAKAGVETPSPEPTQPPTPPTPTPTGPGAEKQLEQMRKFEERANQADERVRKLEEQLANKDRDVFIEAVLRDGKAEPGQRAHIEKMYAAAPEATREFYADAPVNDEWAREYGSDDEELSDEQAEAENKAYEADAQSRLGVAEVL